MLNLGNLGNFVLWLFPLVTTYLLDSGNGSEVNIGGRENRQYFSTHNTRESRSYDRHKQIRVIFCGNGPILRFIT